MDLAILEQASGLFSQVLFFRKSGKSVDLTGFVELLRRTGVFSS
jgi:hypothetical protein